MKETEKSSGSPVVANLDRRKRFKYVLIVEGTLIGFITGALISVFRLMLTGADRLRGMLSAMYMMADCLRHCYVQEY